MMTTRQKRQSVSDENLLQEWSRVTDPKVALAKIVEHQDFLGYDPYYAKLREALLEMAERCSK